MPLYPLRCTSQRFAKVHRNFPMEGGKPSYARGRPCSVSWMVAPNTLHWNLDGTWVCSATDDGLTVGLVERLYHLMSSLALYMHTVCIITRNPSGCSCFLVLKRGRRIPADASSIFFGRDCAKRAMFPPACVFLFTEQSARWSVGLLNFQTQLGPHN